jgi:hypothetical protein
LLTRGPLAPSNEELGRSREPSSSEAVIKSIDVPFESPYFMLRN